MFKNEVIISEIDKEQALYHIKKVNEILNKYPYENGHAYTVTNMIRAKHASLEAEKWIEYLYTEDKRS
jgi:hypothetical protein